MTITINGSNDAAVITVMARGHVTEAGGEAKQHTGQRRAPRAICWRAMWTIRTDALPGEAAGTATVNGYGSYAVTAAGVWTYTLGQQRSPRCRR